MATLHSTRGAHKDHHSSCDQQGAWTKSITAIKDPDPSRFQACRQERKQCPGSVHRHRPAETSTGGSAGKASSLTGFQSMARSQASLKLFWIPGSD